MTQDDIIARIVKPLKWEGEFAKEAKTPWGSCEITDRAGPNADWDYFGYYFTSRGDWDHSEDQYPSPAEAKAAVESDYRARLAAALNLDEVAALVEALKVAGDYIEACKANGLPDLGAASRMPFVADVLVAVDAALSAFTPITTDTPPVGED